MDLLLKEIIFLCNLSQLLIPRKKNLTLLRAVTGDKNKTVANMILPNTVETVEMMVVTEGQVVTRQAKLVIQGVIQEVVADHTTSRAMDHLEEEVIILEVHQDHLNTEDPVVFIILVLTAVKVAMEQIALLVSAIVLLKDFLHPKETTTITLELVAHLTVGAVEAEGVVDNIPAVELDDSQGAGHQVIHLTVVQALEVAKEDLPTQELQLPSEGVKVEAQEAVVVDSCIALPTLTCQLVGVVHWEHSTLEIPVISLLTLTQEALNNTHQEARVEDLKVEPQGEGKVVLKIMAELLAVGLVMGAIRVDNIK